MNWLILVIVVIASDSLRLYVDNYISDVYFKGRDASSQKYFYIFEQLLLAVLLMLIFGVDFSAASPSTFLLFFVSGLIAAVSGIFYYRALEIDDSTNLGIFTQLAPVLYLIFGWLFFGGNISLLQIIACLVILAAPILIVLTSRGKNRSTKLRAVFFAFINVFVGVIGNLIFVHQNVPELSFTTEVAFVVLGKAVGNIIILFIYRKWHRRFKNVVKSSKGKVFRPLVLSAILGTAADFSYRGALLLAPTVALASATTDSVKPITIFFLGIILTLIAPNFGREKLNKKSIIVHLAATVLVVIGIVLIQK